MGHIHMAPCICSYNLLYTTHAYRYIGTVSLRSEQMLTTISDQIVGSVRVVKQKDEFGRVWLFQFDNGRLTKSCQLLDNQTLDNA